MQIVYFAWVRECVGVSGEVVNLPTDVATVSDLLDLLSARSEGHAAAFADRSRLRFAVDLAIADLATPLAGAKEVAIFPPVTGG